MHREIRTTFYLLISFSTVARAQPAKVQRPYPEAVAVVEEDGRIGFIDKTGRYVFGGPFESVDSFSEGLARVKIDGKFGYLDFTGKMVIPPRFDSAQSFSDGRAYVRMAALHALIDKQGTIVAELEFAPEAVWPFSCGLAAVMTAGKRGFIDTSGKLVIAAEFDLAYPFSEDLAYVQVGSRTWFIDKEGKNPFGFDVEYSKPFHEGLTYAGVDEKFGYIDLHGDFVIPPQFEGASVFSEGLAHVIDGGFRYFIDRTGRMAIGHHRYYGDGCTGPAYREGLYAIAIDGGTKCGFIDRKGEIAVRTELPHDTLVMYGFSEGLAAFENRANKTGFIDKSGKVVIAPRFSFALPFVRPDRASVQPCRAPSPSPTKARR